MFRKIIQTIFLIIIIVFGFNILVTPAQAQILPPCTTTGNCTPCDMVQVGVNVGQALLAVIGSLVLLMFVYGGFTMLISAGNPTYVKKGQDILINAIIGLGIVFSAYLLVTAVVTVITGQVGGEAGSGWNWEGKLVCAPVDFSPAVPDNAADLTAAINVPEDLFNEGQRAPAINVGGAPDGTPCTDRNQCLRGICYESADGSLPDDGVGKCQSVFKEGDPCDDQNIDDSAVAGIGTGFDEDIKCYGPGDMVCKDSGINDWGKCLPSGEGTVCYHKKECSDDTFCWEYADGKDNGVGTCTKALKDGDKCEDALVDEYGFDDDIPDAACPTGSKCIDPDDRNWVFGGTTGTCASGAVGATCYYKDHCNSGYCYEFFEEDELRNGIGICVDSLKEGDLCSGSNITNTIDIIPSILYDIPCGHGLQPSSVWSSARCEKIIIP